MFHELTPGATYTYAFVPLKEQEGSLEFKTYASLIRMQLANIGFKEVPGDSAQVVVFFFYGIEGHPVTSTYPIFGQTGTSGSTTTGTVTTFGNTSMISANTTSTPVYGVVGSGVRTDTVFARVLVMQLVDRQASVTTGKVQKLYEGTVTSAGSTANLNVVMPAMVAALFKDFPGKSGSTTSIPTALPRN